MFGLDLVAIGAGLGAAIILSGLVGLVLGAAIAADSQAANETELEAQFRAQMHKPALLAQLAILSLLIALLSGAITAWFAPGAPYLNTTIVGAISTLASLILPSPGFPPLARWLLSLANLPATLAGAWAFVHFAAP